MGNQQSRKLHKQKHKKKNKKRHRQDEFIIELSHNYYSKINQITNVESLDLRRHVFISVIGLFNTYKTCPLSTLYSAVFILSIKKDWIYNLEKYLHIHDECPLNVLAQLPIFNSVKETETFLKLLQWKDSQGLLYCQLDDFSKFNTKTNSLIHPFWRYLSTSLSNLYDSKTNKMYNRLNLNDNYWENIDNKKHTFKYNTTSSSILTELYFLSMQYDNIKEIIYQSNPLSLKPITFYGEDADRFKKYAIDEFCNISEKTGGEWYMSNDYFE